MKHRKAIALLLACVMTLGLFAGCGKSSDDSERKNASQIAAENQGTAAETTEETAAAEAVKKTTYPVTITTYNSDGTEMQTTYEKAPEKVVAVYQGCIETMLALGLEDHLVATAGLDNEVPDEYKAAFSSVQYLDEFTPSKETITMLEPDMIFSWGSLFGEDTLGEAAGWVEKGVNTYMNSNTRPKNGDTAYARTLENEYTDILNMGIIFDCQDKAEALVQAMKDTIANVKEQTAGQDSPSVMVLEFWNDSFANYHAGSLGGDMVVQLGGTLANPDASSVGKEDVIAANPDVIFVVYMPYAGDDPETVMNNALNSILGDESLASLDAVKNNRVYPIMLSEMYASANRSQDGIVTFASGLYPEVSLGE